MFAIGSVKAQDLVQYVQPMSGTAPSTTPASLKHGGGSELNANTIPAVTRPFAMTQWSPQTRTTEKKCLPPYFYKDSLLTGFRGTHWLSGSCTQDYGSFTIMPVTGTLKTSPTKYAVAFTHAVEESTPYHYRIKLSSIGVSGAVTATERCGMLEFTMLRSDSLYILLTPNSDYQEGFVQINGERGEVEGYNPVHRIYQGWGKPAGFNGYFVVQFNRKIPATGVYSGDTLVAGGTIGNRANVGAYAGFYLNAGETLRLRVGTSFTSLAGARKNLDAEMPDFNFARYVQAARLAWQNALEQVTVQTDNEKDKRIFYTAMYHAMQHPRLFNDVDGTYPKFSANHQNALLAKGNYYDDLSMWDIYRAQLPLLEILKPDLVNDIVQSLVLKGQQGGWMPIFPCWNSYTAAMIGDHSSSVIASAYAKGIRRYDVAEAYRLIRQNAFTVPANHQDYIDGKGRRALKSYQQYGYIPLEDSVPDAFHKREQVSRTLEYAYNDYAVFVMAKQLGKSADYASLSKRAGNFANVFDPSVGFMRGRYASGKFVNAFNPDGKEPYITEGTPRQYTFYVPHNVPGLATLMGGKHKLEDALDSLFLKGEYWHGNEPGHQIPFMYNYTNAPFKTSEKVSKILNEEYSDGPGGLSGNDDAGQMSAWYVFAAMGMYPVNPISGEYQLTVPNFKETDIKVGKGKVFRIIVNKQSPVSKHITGLRLNGKAYNNRFITYRDIMNGGVLEMLISEKPATSVRIRSDLK